MAQHHGSLQLGHPEQVDIGDEELEDIIDEEEDGEGDVSELGDKPDEIEVAEDIDEVDDDDDEDVDEEAQEGLDLDMPEEDDGIGYHDEHDDDEDPGFRDGNSRDGGIGYESEAYRESEERNDCEDAVGKDSHEIVDKFRESHYKSSDRKEETEHQGQTFERDGGHGKEMKQGHQNITPTQVYEGHDKGEESKDLLLRPPHGSEVFVGGISKDVVEDDLRELCATCGELFEVRLMKDNGRGENKSFSFITFTNKESADKAIETLNGQELKGRKLRFSASQAKNKLFIGNVPKSWNKEELQRVLLDRAVGITHIELLMDPQNTERNRGFAFVEYHNHACADNAKRKLSMPGFKLGNNTPTINWADARGTPEHAAMSQVKVVYVRNLPVNATQDQLTKLFEQHGEISKVVLPQSRPGQPKRDFGFVHYADRSSALKAIDKAQKYVLEDRVLEVSLAKPPPEKRPSPFYAPVGAGMMPQMYHPAIGYGHGDSDVYGMESGFGFNRTYGQPVIYGRGPAPAGMAMVPMMLPDGRMGYVLQQSGMQAMPAPHRDHRSSGRGSQSQRHSGGAGASGSRRYRPY